MHTALIVIGLLMSIYILKTQEAALNLFSFFDSVITRQVLIKFVLKKTVVASLVKLLIMQVCQIWMLFLINWAEIAK